MDNRLVIHQTDIHVFSKCGLRYLFQKIQKKPYRLSTALVLGRAFDSAVTHNLKQKIETGEDLPEVDVMDVYSQTFEQDAVGADFKEDDPGAAKDAGYVSLQTHHQTRAPYLKPITVQEYFKITLENEIFDLAGTLDYIDNVNGQEVLADTKLVSRQMVNSYVVKKSHQANLYTLAYKATRGRYPAAFRYDIVAKPTKTKAPELQHDVAVVTEDDIAFSTDAARAVAKSVKAGAFPPAPEGAWWCSEKFCPYWNECKGR